MNGYDTCVTGVGKRTLISKLLGIRSLPLPSITTCSDDVWDVKTKYFTVKLKFAVVEDPKELLPERDNAQGYEVCFAFRSKCEVLSSGSL
jgi:hypothetical protein